MPRTPWLRVNMVSTVDGAATGPRRQERLDQQRRRTRRSSTPCAAWPTRSWSARAPRAPRATGRPRCRSWWSAGPATCRSCCAVPTRGRVLMVTCAASPGLAEARALLGDDHVLVLGQDAVDLGALPGALADRGLRERALRGRAAPGPRPARRRRGRRALRDDRAAVARRRRTWGSPTGPPIDVTAPPAHPARGGRHAARPLVDRSVVAGPGCQASANATARATRVSRRRVPPLRQRSSSAG